MSIDLDELLGEEGIDYSKLEIIDEIVNLLIEYPSSEEYTPCQSRNRNTQQSETSLCTRITQKGAPCNPCAVSVSQPDVLKSVLTDSSDANVND